MATFYDCSHLSPPPSRFPQNSEGPPHVEAKEILAAFFSAFSVSSYPMPVKPFPFCFCLVLSDGMPFAQDLIMILVSMHMKVSPAKRQELSQTIISLLSSIRKEQGCERCVFFQDLEDENIFCLLQEWDTRKNLEAHRKSEWFKVLRGAMNLLEEPGKIISYSSIHQPEIKDIGNSFVNTI